MMKFLLGMIIQALLVFQINGEVAIIQTKNCLDINSSSEQGVVPHLD